MHLFNILPLPLALVCNECNVTNNEEFKHPANGKYGTYAQTASQQSLTNGRTFFSLKTANGISVGFSLSGGANSGWSPARARCAVNAMNGSD